MLSRRNILSLGLTAICSQFSFSMPAKKKLLILIEGAGDFQAVAKVLEKSLNLLPLIWNYSGSIGHTGT